MFRKLLVVLFATSFLLSCGSDDSKKLKDSENDKIISEKNVSKRDVDSQNLEQEEIFFKKNDKKIKETNLVFEASLGHLDRDYRFDFNSSSPFQGDHYYIYEGELPRGIELDELTGVLSGHPLEEGIFNMKLAFKHDDGELQIVPFIVTIDTNLVLYKNVASFIDISLSENSTLHEINHNDIINLTAASTNNAFFKFFGTDSNNLRVCEQGYIIVGNEQCNISSNLLGNINIIAPFGDRELTATSDSHIYYQVRGVAPRRMLIIQYKNMHRTGDIKASQNFEVIIHEDSNDIQFLYDLSYSNTDTTQKHLGGSAIIGIMSSTGSHNLISRDQAVVFRGDSITFDYKPSNGTYRTGPNYFKGNVVTNYIDIARPIDGASTCNRNSDCTTNLCNSGICSAKNITARLIYDGSEKINLPFHFSFYGNSYNSIRIHENGYLFFGAVDITYDNVYPTRNNPINIGNFGLESSIIPFFSNIDLKSSRGGNVLYNIIGTEPNRKLVIMYDSIKIKDVGNSGNDNVDQMVQNSTFLVSFEVVLHEGSNIIEFIYGTNNASELDLQNNFAHLNPSTSEIKEALRVYSGAVTSVGLKQDNTRYISIAAGQNYIGQGKSITFVPNDSRAASYTWVGLGNEKNANANAMGNVTIAGGFTPVPTAWLGADDQGPNQFVRYDRYLVSNQWVNNVNIAVDPVLTDDSYREIITNIPYGFYGDKYSNFFIQSNGGITFNSGRIQYRDPGTIDYSASGSDKPDKAIFPFWNDLNPSAGGTVTYGEFTKGGQKLLVVEWNNVPTFSVGGSNTMQAQIYENGDIYFCYQDINDADWNGDSPTHITGIRKDINQKDGYTGSINSLVSNHKCIQYKAVYDYPPGHISATKSTVSGHNDREQNVSLGFDFVLQGTSFDRITISSNGVAVLENSAHDVSHVNKRLSDVNTNTNSINLFWDALAPRDDGHSGVFYTTQGTAPNRYFLLTYNNVGHQNATMHLDAQMILKEGSNKIVFCYGNASGGLSDASEATIGVKVSNTDYQEYSYNSAKNLANKCWEWNKSTPGFSPTRNLYTGKMNSHFIDIPVISPLAYGETLKSEYTYGTETKPYAIFDLNRSGVNYPFSFKNKTYDQLFVEANGAVSFGNSNSDAAIVSGPMWGNSFTQVDLTQQSNHPALSSPYDNVEANFMWIANAGDNTLAKINTFTGEKMGTFAVGSNPSRTAVGFDGAVWVGNRDSHNVTKLDRNGNFVCTVELNDSCAPRALALDKDENVWVGCKRWSGSTEGWVYKIRHNHTTNTCEILDLREPTDHSSDLSFKGHTGHGTYGFAIDRNGILWSSGLGSKILRIDTNKRPGDVGFYKRFDTPANRRTYGIAIDRTGVIWHAIWKKSDGTRTKGEILIRSTYNESTGVLSSTVLHSTGNQSYGRGVAIDGDGNVWTPSTGWDTVSKFRPDGTFVAHYDLHCDGPIGVGVDQDGDIWGNCYYDGYSSELDRNGRYIRKIETGDSPYCYSDNTGFNLRNIVAGSKPTKFYAGIVEEKVVGNGHCASDPSLNYQFLKRKLIVQWKDVRLKPNADDPIQDGNTELNYEMIFDNGTLYKCDGTSPVNVHPVSISYVYGAMQGNRVVPKTGGRSSILMRANDSGYSHNFSTTGDAGTVNTGSEFIIKSK